VLHISHVGYKNNTMTRKPATPHHALTRRERQIMDILYRRGPATAGEVMEELSGSPNYSTVRTQLRVLEEKGHVRHEENRAALRILAGDSAQLGAQVGAPASGRHVLRRLRRKRHYRHAGRRGDEVERRRARSHCRSREAVESKQSGQSGKGEQS
jgi:DNA-binding CsgD family transcriptional regulator